MDRIGRYKIVRELGRGAMGVVYHAIDPNIGRPVAIKTIQLGGKPEERERLRERLFREARSAGILSHPGIVTIYDVEQQGDLAYIAMEYVDGPTLDQVLAPNRAASQERIFSVLAQTAAALDYAHRKGIVHRDVKPANIMIAGGGAVKITDFGIAKVASSEQLTMTGNIVGTPHYMSPEQVQGKAVDGRSDQYSLAVIAFEMLTGDKPHSGEQLTTVVYKIVAEEPIPARRLNPTLSAAIEAVLRRALAKNPDDRYGNCQEMVDALEAACAASPGWRALPRGGASNEPTAMDSVAPAIAMPPPRRARDGSTVTAERPARRKSGFLPFLAAVLMAAAVLALIGWQADPTLPHKLQGVAQRIQTAVGLGAAPAPPAAAPSNPPQAPPASQPSPLQAEVKPSPMPPSPGGPAEEPAQPPPARPAPVAPSEEPAPRPAEPERKRAPVRPPANPQPVAIVSSPAGATATLDGRADAECTTPCSLQASPGHHTLAVVMPGHQIEHRDVDVETGPVELPPIVLRTLTGTLMLSTVPDGAAISVNGRRISQITPAQISLAPGNYKITVEKGGKQAASSVEIRIGAINYLRLVIE
jgi:serine/threonine-protein kinase